MIAHVTAQLCISVVTYVLNKDTLMFRAPVLDLDYVKPPFVLIVVCCVCVEI